MMWIATVPLWMLSAACLVMGTCAAIVMLMPSVRGKDAVQMFGATVLMLFISSASAAVAIWMVN